ncbi:unnamed protein product [Rotaria magnacalcarata]|uniref:NAD(+) ADP-ribosyltransferase n=1 Tax=Rotaria magnacalcarata TaxID=392030 RepID=A0A819YCV4_9BILA|nr:unnamed protein product [Rotaria magnacalcarata]CAF4157634.1 unnamed protein product [Rotaria magnacalcarata]
MSLVLENDSAFRKYSIKTSQLVTELHININKYLLTSYASKIDETVGIIISFKARLQKSVPDKIKLKLNDGAAVDPDSGLENTCHVLKDTETGEIYIAVLDLVDIMRGTNSYYKMQSLESDNGNEWLDRKYSQNLPNKYYPLEIDYGQHADNDTMQKLLESANINIYSKLPKSVEELIKKIFKVKTMKEALLAL